MPTRNVYVSETDVALFDRAAKLGGGLSPAIAAALRLYLSRRENLMTTHQHDTIELEVADGPLSTHQSFQGRKLVGFAQQHGLRTVSYTAYGARRGQYAVYITDKPDWSRMAEADESVWNDRATWSGQFYETKDRSLSVYPTVQAMLQELPEDVAAAVEQALTGPIVTEMDI